MKLRSSVFDSKSESKVFCSLQSRWSPKLVLYPSLPLSKIVQIDPQELTLKEREFFYKTNVDYTFCEPHGVPILSIEFDGIGGGFSRDGTYIQGHKTPDPNRKMKMDFKLRVTRAVNYPLVVVSYEEIESLGEEDSLTILDGIVGQFLARREFHNRIEEMVAESQAMIDGLGDYDKREFIQDLVATAEVQAELDQDPIAKKAADYDLACFEHGINGHRVEYMDDPPLPDIKDMFDVKGLEARIGAMKHTIRVGCRIIIKTPKVVVIQPVWVRNFEGYSISPRSIAENIAEYLAFKRAYSLVKDLKKA